MEAIFSWEYVAGLFDGEGNVYAGMNGGSPSIRVYLAQSGEQGLTVLTELSVWLKARGIVSHLHKEGPTYRFNFKTELPAYRLYIWRRQSVLEFLANVLPYLHIKVKQVLKHTGKFEGLKRERAVKREFKKYSKELEEDNYKTVERCVI